MARLISNIKPDELKDKYVFLDTDFLSLIYGDFDAFQDTFSFCIKGSIFVDPIVRLEFLQSTFVPRLRELKEEFLSLDTFSPVTEHPEVFEKVRKNALALSVMYAHKKYTGISLGDLLLAGRAILYEKSLIITGNRKDYPSFIFDSIGILNYEDEKSNVRAYSIITLNVDKFENARNELLRIPYTI